MIPQKVCLYPSCNCLNFTLPILGEVWSLRSAHSFHMLSGSGCQSTPLQQSLLRLGFTGRGGEPQALVSQLKLSKWYLNRCSIFSNHLEIPSSHGSQQHSQISEDKVTVPFHQLPINFTWPTRRSLSPICTSTRSNNLCERDISNYFMVESNWRQPWGMHPTRTM